LVQKGTTIAFVPTMGYFHEGHLALMRKWRLQAEILVVSIFVNPTQFAPAEDFERYPRDMERDLRLAESVGVDIVFAPEVPDMYGERHQTYVDPEELSKCLCGRSRPKHFRGVATVVTKLLNIVKPNIAIFGEKDYQQWVIIRQLAQDLNFDMKILSVPTVRESDGLAMSSRNAYLSKQERRSALSLHQSLQNAKKMVNQGVQDADAIVARTWEFIRSHPDTRKDYVTLCDPATLEDVDRVDKPTLLALAILVGKTRLIDNVILSPPPS